MGGKLRELDSLALVCEERNKRSDLGGGTREGDGGMPCSGDVVLLLVGWEFKSSVVGHWGGFSLGTSGLVWILVLDWVGLRVLGEW